MFWMIPVGIVLLALVLLGLALRAAVVGLPALRRARRRVEIGLRRTTVLQSRLSDLQQEVSAVQQRSAAVAARLAELKVHRSE